MVLCIFFSINHQIAMTPHTLGIVDELIRIRNIYWNEWGLSFVAK